MGGMEVCCKYVAASWLSERVTRGISGNHSYHGYLWEGQRAAKGQVCPCQIQREDRNSGRREKSEVAWKCRVEGRGSMQAGGAKWMSHALQVTLMLIRRKEPGD